MSDFGELVADFPAEYGAGADSGLRGVLRAVVDGYQDSLRDQIAAGTESRDALHIASMAAVARICAALGADFETVTTAGVVAGVMNREFTWGVS